METTSGEHGWGPHTRDIPCAVSSIVTIFEHVNGHVKEEDEHAMRHSDKTAHNNTRQ